MLKTISLITIITVLTISITGCSKEAQPEAEDDFRCKQENVLAPKWTCIPNVDNYYSGVGIAQKSAAGMAHMKRVAVANGRSDLAQQIKSDIKDKITIYSGTTGVSSDETIDQTTEAVTKQLAKVSLVGSKAVDSWTSPSGAYLKTSYKNERALWQQFKAKNALENLEKDFADQ